MKTNNTLQFKLCLMLCDLFSKECVCVGGVGGGRGVGQRKSGEDVEFSQNSVVMGMWRQSLKR